MAETTKSIVKNGVHSYTAVDEYVSPQDPILLEQLKQFQDKKIGLMMHWAPGSQIGIYESWCMSDDSAHWSKKDIDWTEDMALFREQYRGLAHSFNPIRFQPEAWAELAEECGFQYLLFTTKHHDGFCMWDTKTTDYRVTHPSVPFSKHAYADICKELFDAFRNKGIAVHAYYSKPDWSSPFYWAPEHEAEDGKTARDVNYDVEQYPELWDKYVEFTHEQIRELMSDYGKIDVLWLDGGWVRPDRQGQDLKISELASHIRETTQPHLLVVDRTVGGPNENFITPEQTVPEEPIMVPWESCVTLGSRFSFLYEENFKSPRAIIHLLIQIVAKGGNLALNIAPQPDGRLPSKGIDVLKQLGEFLSVYGEAIYETRSCEPYVQEQAAYTRKGNHIYMFHMYSDEQSAPIGEYKLPYFGELKSVQLLGQAQQVKADTILGEATHIHLPLRTWDHAPYADVIRIELE